VGCASGRMRAIWSGLRKGGNVASVEVGAMGAFVGGVAEGGWMTEAQSGARGGCCRARTERAGVARCGKTANTQTTLLLRRSGTSRRLRAQTAANASIRMQRNASQRPMGDAAALSNVVSVDLVASAPRKTLSKPSAISDALNPRKASQFRSQAAQTVPMAAARTASATALPAAELVQRSAASTCASTPSTSGSSSSTPGKATSRKTWSGYWAPRATVLLVSALWGSNFGMVKYLQEALGGDVATAAAVRFTVAAVAFAPFAFSAPPSKAAVVGGFGVGLATFLGYLCQCHALSSSGASTTAFFCALNVICVPALAAATNEVFARFTRTTAPPRPKRPMMQSAIVAVLAIAGVAMLELGGAQSSGMNVDLWAFGQPLGFGLGYVLNQVAIREDPDCVAALSAIQFGVIAALATVWAVAENGFGHVFATVSSMMGAGATQDTLGAVAYTGIITTALAIWASNEALKKVDARDFSVLLCTEPLFAAAFARVLLAEPMGLNTLLGGTVIVGSCLVAELGSPPPKSENTSST